MTRAPFYNSLDTVGLWPVQSGSSGCKVQQRPGKLCDILVALEDSWSALDEWEWVGPVQGSHGEVHPLIRRSGWQYMKQHHESHAIERSQCDVMQGRVGRVPVRWLVFFLVTCWVWSCVLKGIPWCTWGLVSSLMLWLRCWILVVIHWGWYFCPVGSMLGLCLDFDTLSCP